MLNLEGVFFNKNLQQFLPKFLILRNGRKARKTCNSVVSNRWMLAELIGTGKRAMVISAGKRAEVIGTGKCAALRGDCTIAIG